MMNSTKSLLIIGGSGFIGTHLATKLRENYKVFATYFKHPIQIPGVTILPFNVENRNWVKRVMYTAQPDIVIYVAGSNHLEWSEANSREVERVQSNGPAIVANSADILQPRFIYISNPYVFDGTRGNYRENDTVLPWSVLGRMKLGGENVVRSKCLNYIVLRSSPVFGRSNGINLSFLDRLRMKLDRGERIELAAHELHSFALVDGLCEAALRLAESGIKNRIIHYGGLTKVSLFEFARAFATQFNYDPNLIVASKGRIQKKSGVTEDFLFDFSMNSTQAAETLKIKPLLLEEGFDLIEKQLIPGP
jgi:dTDP-4-dehydrorhamnose reductase